MLVFSTFPVFVYQTTYQTATGHPFGRGRNRTGTLRVGARGVVRVRPVAEHAGTGRARTGAILAMLGYRNRTVADG